MTEELSTFADSVSSPDLLQVDETLQSGVVPEEAFTQKDIYWIQDQNNGVYSGNSFTIDTTSLANSGKWLSYQEGWLAIPFMITLRSSATAVGAGSAMDVVNAFVVGLKNGSHQLIDAVQLEVNGVSVHSQQPFKNMHINYNLMTEWSQDDLQKWGPTINFYPDGQSSIFRGAASVDGIGVCNNRTNAVAAVDYTGGTTGLGLNPFNVGHVERLKQTAYPIITGKFVGFGGQTGISTQAQANLVGKNYMHANDPTGTAAAGTIWQWNLICQIKLPHLADYFNKVPLSKGSRMRLTVYYNACDIAITAAAGPVLSHTTTMRAGRTCPLLVSSGSANNAYASLAAIAGTHTISCGIGNSATNQLGNQFFAAPRLYVPAYTLTQKYEEQIISMGEREVSYEDIQSFIINNGGSGYGTNASFNFLLTNGLKSLKRLIVMAQPNPTSNASTNPLTSPWDSAPSTTAPYSTLTNLNVLVSGKNVFNANLLYSFENFQQEVSKTGLNGGLTDGLASGLISQRMFEMNHAYYTVNLARRLSADDEVPMSVQLNATNVSNLTIDLYAFLTFQRKVKLNLVNGDVSML